MVHFDVKRDLMNLFNQYVLWLPCKFILLKDACNGAPKFWIFLLYLAIFDSLLLLDNFAHPPTHPQVSLDWFWKHPSPHFRTPKIIVKKFQFFREHDRIFRNSFIFSFSSVFQIWFILLSKFKTGLDTTTSIILFLR